MASPGGDIPLAKGIFQGALSRQDNGLPAIPKAGLLQFHSNLERLLWSGSTTITPEFLDSVAWIVANVVSSSSRSGALGKYLVKLATSLVSPADSHSGNATFSDSVDPRRRRDSNLQPGNSAVQAFFEPADARPWNQMDKYAARLCIMQLIDQVFHTIKHSSHDDLSDSNFVLDGFATALKPHVIDMIRITAPRDSKQGLQFHQAIRHLVGSWKDAKVYSASDLIKVRDPAREAYRTWLHWLRTAHPATYRIFHKPTKVSPDATETPRFHGDHKDAWHHLPAACIIPLIQGRRPIPTSLMRPLSLSDDPIDNELLSIVATHIAESNTICAMPRVCPYPADSGTEVKLNGLGLRLTTDPSSGKRKLAETYYGYSPAYAEAMKRRKQNPPDARKRTQLAGVASLPLPPPPSMTQHFSTPPPPPPPLAASAIVQSLPPPPPPPVAMHMQIPPGPSNWQGAWPPPPPPPEMGRMPVPPPPPPIGRMPFPPPFPASMAPADQGGYGYGRGGGNMSGRGRYDAAFRGGYNGNRARGGYGR